MAARTPGRVGRPPGIDGDDTRQRIIDVARAAFASHGYAATTNRTIADRAGLTAAAVYHHFGKKPDLMVAVHRANEERYLGRIAEAIAAAGTFREKVFALLDVIHETMRLDPEMVTFFAVAQDEARRHPELQAISEDRTFPRMFAELVESGVQEGVIAKRDASYARGAIAAIATGLAMMVHDLSVEAHRTATEGAKLLLNGSLLGPAPG